MTLALIGLCSATLRVPVDFPDKVSQVLQRTCLEHKIPGAVVVVLRKHKELCSVTYGVRRQGSDQPLAVSDSMHLGSLTKSFTGFLIAESGISLESPVTAVLPDLKLSKFGAGVEKLKLRNLVFQDSGLIQLQPGSDAWPKTSREPVKTRLQVARHLLAADLSFEPGSRFEYNNMNYVLLGAILDHQTGRSWEDLVKSQIYKPMNWKSAGFGPTGVMIGDQPSSAFQHASLGDLRIPTTVDNPSWFGPAGTCHMSARDLASWGDLVMAGIKGESNGRAASLNKPMEFWKRLVTPPEGKPYAFGWVTGPESHGNRQFGHSGSNTVAVATLIVDPKSQSVIVVMANAAPNLSIADSIASEIGRLLEVREAQTYSSSLSRVNASMAGPVFH